MGEAFAGFSVLICIGLIVLVGILIVAGNAIRIVPE